MKNYFPIVALLMISFGCTQQNSDADKGNAEAAIKGFYSAAQKFDYTAMRTFCTTDFHAIEDGKTYNNLDELIAVVKMLEGSTVQIKPEIVKTDVGKDMAMSIVNFDAQFEKDAVKSNLKTIENYLLKKIDGKWLIDFFQSTYLTGPKKLEKGSILGIHILSDLELKPGVTNAQVTDFMLRKYSPAFNSMSEDVKVIPIIGLRGDSKDKFGFIFYLTSDEVRNSIWAAEGTLTPKGQAMFKELQPIIDEQDKLFTYKKDPYTDWRIE
jgi:hypothetical protein